MCGMRFDIKVNFSDVLLEKLGIRDEDNGKKKTDFTQLGSKDELDKLYKQQMFQQLHDDMREVCMI